MISRVLREPEAKLFLVVDAADLTGTGAGTLQRRHQHCYENRNDHYNHEKIDQRKKIFSL